jgi:uncharacterized protein YidB (DUF937 family)
MLARQASVTFEREFRGLVNTFKQAGQAEVADSWIGRGAKKQIAPSHTEIAKPYGHMEVGLEHQRYTLCS